MAVKKLQIRDLTIGSKEQGYMLATKITDRNSSKCSWCDVELSDGHKTIKAKCWNVTKDTIGITEKSVIGVEIITDEYNGAPSYTINQYKATTNEETGFRPFHEEAEAEILQLEPQWILRLCLWEFKRFLFNQLMVVHYVVR